MSERWDVIKLTGLSAVANHGVYQFEREGGQIFTVDLVLYYDASAAAMSDRIEDTVDYGKIAEDAVAILQGPPVHLLETLATAMAMMALEHPLVVKAEATVHKPMAPIRHRFSDVSVTVVRERVGNSVTQQVTVDETPLEDEHPSGADQAANGVHTPDSVRTPDAALTSEEATPEVELPVEELVEVAAEGDSSTPDGAAHDEARSGDETGSSDEVASAEEAPKPVTTAPSPPLRRRVRTQRQHHGEHVYDVVLALGSNEGDIFGNLTGAVGALVENPAFEVVAVSDLVRTKPVLEPGSLPQDDYYNAVVLGRTPMSPPALLETVQKIEADYGRKRTSRWAARTLDIDIIMIGEMELTTRALTVPHPRADSRAFVLYPWSLIQPDATIPGKGRVQDLLEKTTDRSGIKAIRKNWLQDATSENPGVEEKLSLVAEVELEEKRESEGDPEKVVIRGWNIGLQPTSEDQLFRRLLKKESEREPELPRRALRREDRPRRPIARPRPPEKPVRHSLPPTRPEVQPPKPLAPTQTSPTPPPPPTPQPAPAPTLPQAPPQAPDQAADQPQQTPEEAPRRPVRREQERSGVPLPNWNFYSESDNVRVIDSSEINGGAKEADTPTVALPKVNRNVTVRPTPTGSMPIQKAEDNGNPSPPRQ